MGSGEQGAATSHVVIVQRSLRRYREEFYEQLRLVLAEQGVDLRVLHSTPDPVHDPRSDAADLAWAERLPRRDITAGSRTLVVQPYVRSLRSADLIIAEQAADLMLNYVLLAHQALGGPKLALWGHGKNFDTSNSSRIGEHLKRWFSKKAHWWFPYNDRAMEVVTELGFPPDRITVVRNATDTQSLAAAMGQIDATSRIQTLDALGLRGSNTTLFVGTLERRKKLAFLFAAADEVRGQIPDFELIIAGSGPAVDEVKRETAKRPWVRYLGQLLHAQLAPLFDVSKLLLVPGWVGLIAVDSFAAGVPLVASSSALHPPEVAYIRSGVNGLIVDDGGNPNLYASEVVRLLRDEPSRQQLVDGCLKERELYTVEAMVTHFAHGIGEALRR